MKLPPVSKLDHALAHICSSGRYGSIPQRFFLVLLHRDLLFKQQQLLTNHIFPTVCIGFSTQAFPSALRPQTQYRRIRSVLVHYTQPRNCTGT